MKMDHATPPQANIPLQAIERFIRLYATDMNGSLQTIIAEVNKAKSESDLNLQATRLRVVRQTIAGMKNKLELMKASILNVNENYPQ